MRPGSRTFRLASEHVLMRAPQDLLDLPFTFTQLHLVTADGFQKAAKERGLALSDWKLEALHRSGVLVPFLRVRRDGREIARLARRGEPVAWQLAHLHHENREDLVEARARGRLFDAVSEPFVARRRMQRRAGDVEYTSSQFLYSEYQLLALPAARALLPYLRQRNDSDPRSLYFDVHRLYGDWWRREAEALAGLTVPLSVLEPAYYPNVVGKLRMGFNEEFDRYERWRRRRALTATKRWLDVPAAWFKTTAADLLHIADRIDPLGDWLEVVRHGDASLWTRLKGEARNAIDFRIAAELCLAYYEELAKGRRAPPLPAREGRWRGEFDGRLKARGPKDPVLTKFGLSPYPRLVLVVEGGTEHLLIPRLLKKFGIRTDEEFISIQDAEGVHRDITTLISYAIGPRATLESNGRYLELSRPLTRVLVVADAEGPLTTKRDRDAKRREWIARLLRTLPKEHRTSAVEEALHRLVYLETWTTSGLSFEFAHFTDRQLASAIARIDRRKRQPDLADRVEHVKRVRAANGNLKKVLGRTSKLELAEQLWPVLEAKIDRAVVRKTEERIPIVRVLDRATDLARELHRRNVVIPLAHAD